MKKIYSAPQLQIVHVEVQASMLQMSVNDKEISKNYGLTKENGNEWGNIWDDEKEEDE